MPGRAEKIASYLIEREQHFFPSIVVGVHLGEPTWYPVSVEDNEILGTPSLDALSKETLGILELDGSEELYAIDGQHRVAGIKTALELLSKEGRDSEYNLLSNETISVAFVSANRDEDTGLERVRRLFTTLNKEAKKVSEPEVVALDEDDPAAIVTRWVATRYEGLKPYYLDEKESQPNLIQLSRQHEIRETNRRSISTIVTLYRMIKSVFQPKIASLNRYYKGNRPDEAKLEELYDEAVSIWELLRKHDPALKEVLGTDPCLGTCREVPKFKWGPHLVPSSRSSSVLGSSWRSHAKGGLTMNVRSKAYAGYQQRSPANRGSTSYGTQLQAK